MRWPAWERNPDDQLIYEHVGQQWLDLARLARIRDDEDSIETTDVWSGMWDTGDLFTFEGRVYQVYGRDYLNVRIWIGPVLPVPHADAAEAA